MCIKSLDKQLFRALNHSLDSQIYSWGRNFFKHVKHKMVALRWSFYSTLPWSYYFLIAEVKQWKSGILMGSFAPWSW